MKYKTLKHNGPLFPAKFDTVKEVTVNNEKITGLPLEMLYNYARYIETDYVNNPIFNNNFQKCFFLECEKVGIKTFDFPKAYESTLKKFRQLQVTISETKKARSKEEKLLEKEEKEAIKAKYGFAEIDGSLQPIGAYTIEPPGLFMGRGDSPLSGLWKYRVEESDVTINCTSDAPAGNWKKVVDNKNAFFTFSFDVNVGNVQTIPKNIRFSYSSSVGQTQDIDKFKRAKNLAANWTAMQNHIKNGYRIDSTEDSKTIEAALVAWLVQNTCIRIGNEKDLKVAADVVGASTLKVENIKIGSDSITLKFLGKDSIEYNNKISIKDKDVLFRLQELVAGKKKSDKVFSVSSGDVNTFLQKELDDISAKMFRPALGTSILVEELKKQNVKKTATVAQKKLAFQKANIKTAELLNHKKAVSKGYNDQYKKLEETLETAKERLVKIQEESAVKLQAIKKDLEIANAAFSGKKLTEVKTRIKEKSNKIKERVEKQKERVSNIINRMDIKKDTKEIATGTSLGSYIDPQAVISWAKDVDMPIEKLYTKAILTRFSWADNTPATYWRNYVRN